MKKMTVAFRFLALTPQLGKELQRNIPTSTLSRHFKTKKVVGCIPVTCRTKIKQIAEFQRTHSVALADCDVFVSVSTDRDTEIVDVPKIVNRIIKEIDCRVVFSFTCA